MPRNLDAYVQQKRDCRLRSRMSKRIKFKDIFAIFASEVNFCCFSPSQVMLVYSIKYERSCFSEHQQTVQLCKGVVTVEMQTQEQ